MAQEIRKLKANEIECRVGQSTANGFSILLYKNARVDMQILDETFGATNWQRDHKEIKGNLYCGIGIWDKEKQQWIWKWDCGVESRFDNDGNEKKGEASDSFKRAGFNVGIGRELYTAPFIWIKDNVKSIERKDGKPMYVPTIRNVEVRFIDYNKNGEIAHLKIYGDNKMIFGYNEPTEEKEEPKSFTPKDLQQEDTIIPSHKTITLEEAEDCKTPRGAKLGDLTYDQLKQIEANDKYDDYVRKCAKIVAVSLEDFVRDDNGDILF